MTRVRVPGRGWAYTGAVLGGVASIAANVAHSFIPPHGAPSTWHPEPGAVVGAIVWPVFLFVAVEILARVTWPTGSGWQVLRWGGLLPVAVVAAFVSYRHLSGLLAHYGEEPIVYYLGPLAVDGLMVMATGALLATARHRADTRSSSDTRSAPADTASLSIVDFQPAPPAPAVPTPATVAARITPPRPASTPPTSAPSRPTPATPRPRPQKTTPPASRTAPSATDTPVTAPDAAQPTLPVVPPALLARAREVATEYHTEHGTPITAGQLAVRLKVTSEQATQALAALPVNGTPVQVTR